MASHPFFGAFLWNFMSCFCRVVTFNRLGILSWVLVSCTVSLQTGDPGAITYLSVAHCVAQLSKYRFW